MTISFTGVSSVEDRTIFTNRGPICKKPVSILTGSDLKIISNTEVVIPSGAFTQNDVGRLIEISGSPDDRNDGRFKILKVLNSTTLLLDGASFSIVDISATTNRVVELANDIRRAYNAHVLSSFHEYIIVTDLVDAQQAVDLASAHILLNQIKSRMNVHVVSLVGVHPIADYSNVVSLQNSTNLASAVTLANEIRRAFESHRQITASHPVPDHTNRIVVGPVEPVVGVFPGPLTGPFTWTLYDPRYGQIADDPSDVIVRVNGTPVAVEAVIGLIGAVVLETKPGPTDTVVIDYSHIDNPPTQIQRLNSPEFSLNQDGNRGLVGLPRHKYRARSTLLVPTDTPLVRSPKKPKRIGWKYKAIERAYSACLNDPNTLLLNVPTNRINYNGAKAVARETVIRYDPSTLPQNATDPWLLKGISTGLSLTPGGFELSISHNGSVFGTSNLPPFFSHELGLEYPSLTSAAFRTKIDSYTLDGCFTGVCFGISDGARVGLIGFLRADAKNLSGGIELANQIRAAFDAHVISSSHIQPDTSSTIPIVNATNSSSLIILANSLRSYYLLHIAKDSTDSIHTSADVVNVLTSPEAKNVSEAIVLLNELRTVFNSHIIDGVHTTLDTVNSVDKIKQVGIFTGGYLEDESSWEIYSVDWTQYKTYRVFRASDGAVSLFFSGLVQPVISIGPNGLPPVSSLDGDFDPLQQVFFGTIGKESSSLSKWAFIRVNTTPINFNQVASTKFVVYQASVHPELDPNAPWIPIGQGGFEWQYLNQLVVDSTSFVSEDDSEVLGDSSGPYRGFIRLEPTLSSSSTCSLEFTGKVGFYTFGISRLTPGIFIDDNEFSTHLLFLQANPIPAEVTGVLTEPFAIVSGDRINLSVNDGVLNSIVFNSFLTSASDIVNFINGSSIPGILASVSGSAVKISTTSVGASSKLIISGGSATVKLGINTGTFFGSDSNPEPKISWFGYEKPENSSPFWFPNGNQSSSMFGRTLRITDVSTTDFLSYSLDDSLITSRVFDHIVDWKSSFRLSSVSYQQGDSLSGLYFCGALLNIDEGPLGKNIEIQLAVDVNENPFVHIVSYNQSTDNLTSVAQFPFEWNDGVHTFDISTSRTSSLIIVSADGAVLGTVPYGNFEQGVFGPSITFGSGSSATLNTDPRESQSIFDWESVCVFRDSRISDPNTVNNRYIGIYQGGDETRLSSYRLAQIDWSLNHTYKIVRDPSSSVSVFINGSAVPSISINYDVLSLPPVGSSFLQKASSGRPLIAFGSFSPLEISRTHWTEVKYSLGLMTQTNNIVPPHQEINRANIIASPDHLYTKLPHQHFGFRVYSGGTPTDDFMSDPQLLPFTKLNEDTPPVPMTQDLESRGGLVKSIVKTNSVDAEDVAYQRGFFSNYEDDDMNVIANFAYLQTQAISDLVACVNELHTLYNSHRLRSAIHDTVDSVNVASSPIATDLSTAIVRINNVSTIYNNHLNEASVHFHDDDQNEVTAPSATDLDSAIILAQDLYAKFSNHQKQGKLHTLDDTYNLISAFVSEQDVYDQIWDISNLFNSHLIQPGIHQINDVSNSVSVPMSAPTNLNDALVLAQNLRTAYNNHLQNSPSSYHFSPDLANLYSPSNPTDFSSLVVFSEQFLRRYRSHLVSSVHILIDSFNSYSNEGSLSIFLNSLVNFRAAISSHRTHVISGGNTYTFHKYKTQSNLSPEYSRYNHLTGVYDIPSICSEVNQLSDDLIDHLSSDSHFVPDTFNSLVSPIADDFLSAINRIYEVIQIFNDHLNGNSWHSTTDGQELDKPVSSIPKIPLDELIDSANLTRDVLNSHFTRSQSHVELSDSDLILENATDLSGLISLVNLMKEKFNLHISENHVTEDTINVISTPDGIDIDSVGILLSDIQSSYELHRVESGVHGSSVLISLDAPDRVLYEGMKFFKTVEGDPWLLSPFSDECGLRMGGIEPTTNLSMRYPGGALPEQSTLVNTVSAPFSIVDGDTLILSLDGSVPITVVFTATDTSVLNVINRINSTPGISSLLASDPGDGSIRLTSLISTPNSNVQVLGGTALTKLGFSGAQPGAWTLLAGDLSKVQVQLLSTGITDFLRINTTEPGYNALYRTKTGLTDLTYMDFDVTFSIRINAAHITNSDTGVLIGISGIAGPGFTAALGFEVVSGVRLIKLIDLNNGKVHFQRLFDWGDGLFHKYRISRKTLTDSIQVMIVS